MVYVNKISIVTHLSCVIQVWVVYSQIWFGDKENHSYSQNMTLLDVMRVGNCTRNHTQLYLADSKELVFEIFMDTYPDKLHWSVVESND